jgi:hypothetical protein
MLQGPTSALAFMKFNICNCYNKTIFSVMKFIISAPLKVNDMISKAMNGSENEELTIKKK